MPNSVKQEKSYNIYIRPKKTDSFCIQHGKHWQCTCDMKFFTEFAYIMEKITQLTGNRKNDAFPYNMENQTQFKCDIENLTTFAHNMENHR